jgi:hypothetical protein
MIHIGFTGTQHGMSEAQKLQLYFFLQSQLQSKPPLVFHHGLCIGADAEAAEMAMDLGYWVVAHPGNNPSKQSKERLYDELRSPLPNLERNLVIVKLSNLLISAPQQNKEIQRSGTWSTVRRARDAHIPTVMLWR